jgi:sugar/nucleoside kinase (ribokinase family)
VIELDILCIGRACRDLSFRVPRHPAADEKLFADTLVSFGGGAAARLGCRTVFAGYLGNDTWGDLHVREFLREGVRTDFFIPGNDLTPLAAVPVKPDGSRSVVNYRRPALGVYSEIRERGRRSGLREIRGPAGLSHAGQCGCIPGNKRNRRS